MIFIIHFSVIILLFIFSKLIKRDKFFVFSTFTYSLFVFGQRWMVGTDFGNYLMYYIYDYQGTEVGYRFLQNIFTEYNLSFSLFVFLLYLLTQFNFYKFMSKFNMDYTLIILFYCLSEIYFAETSQIRQWIAISFFVNAYYYLYFKKYVKTFFLILLGFIFHKSIIFVIPFMFIKFDKLIKIKKLAPLFILILLCLPFVNLNYAFSFLHIFDFVKDYEDSRYVVSLSYFHIAKYYFLIICTLIMLNNIDWIKIKLNSMIINGQLIYLFLYGLSMQMGAFIRFAYFFKIFEILFFVCLIPFLRGIDKKQMLILFTIYSFIMYGAISIIDTVELSHYRMRLISIFEPYSDQQLIIEFYDFLQRAGRLNN
ncbi:MAG: EpsG family protein [Solibacillus sp.]